MVAEGLNPVAPRLPFDAEFQKSLLKLLCEDSRFGHAVGEHIQPQFFENEVLAWAWSYARRFKQEYGAFPGVHTIAQQARTMDPKIRPIYEVTMEQVRHAPMKDEAWMRNATLDYIKRNIFVRTFQESRSLYNAGKVDQAYDLMMARMERLQKTTWSAADEGWFFEELPERQIRRMTNDVGAKAIATGLHPLDNILGGGLSKGEFGLWVAYAKTGKALRDDQLVLTPTGERPIGTLQVGDEVIGGSTGLRQLVLGVFPQGIKSLYEIKFRDGASVIASGDHLWKVKLGNAISWGERGHWQTVTTSQLVGRDFFVKKGCAVIPHAPQVQGYGAQLPLNGYLLGLLLGDGGLTGSTIRFHKPERDLWKTIREILPTGDVLVEHVEHEDTRCPYVSIVAGVTGERTKNQRSRTAKILADFGLMGMRGDEKFIPECVFVSSVKDRFDVLSGLCDTDGSVTRTGCAIEFSSCSQRLALGVVSLARSLGGQARMTEKLVNGVIYWRVHLGLLDGRIPVRSVKNGAKLRTRTKGRYRYIDSVTQVSPDKCTCISVDDPEGLFITQGHVVTHNTTMLTQHGMAATKQLRRVAHFVFEGSRAQVEDRYESGFTQELYRSIRTDGLTSAKYQEAYQEYQLLKGCLYIRGFVEEWNYTCADVHESLKDLKRLHGWEPDLVIIDYGDLINGRARSYANDRENQKAAYRDMKSLANRGYAVWSASQAQRPDKGSEDSAHWLYARQIADCYEKVRVADFIGSLNITNEERRANVMRLLAELYRDNAANLGWVVSCNFSTMTIRCDPNAKSPSDLNCTPEGAAPIGLNTERPKQRYPVKVQPPAPPAPQPMQAPLR